MQTQSHLLFLNEVLCSKWQEDLFFSFPVTWELCIPRFMEFLMEIRGSFGLNCCAAHVRMFCRTVAEALRNCSVHICLIPWDSYPVRGVNSLDHIMGNHWWLLCSKFLSSYQQEIRAFYPWRGWEVWPQEKKSSVRTGRKYPQCNLFLCLIVQHELNWVSLRMDELQLCSSWILIPVLNMLLLIVSRETEWLNMTGDRFKANFTIMEYKLEYNGVLSVL